LEFERTRERWTDNDVTDTPSDKNSMNVEILLSTHLLLIEKVHDLVDVTDDYGLLPQHLFLHREPVAYLRAK
jgi:hypothetical protein